MSKTSLIAVHRILLKPKPVKYAEPDTRFSIDSEEAERLIKLGAAKRPSKGTTEVTEKAPVSDEARVALLTQTIKALTEADFDTNGKPKVGRINSSLPEDAAKTNVAERDEVWAGMSDDGDDLV